MADDDILTPGQVEQLTNGLGAVLPVTEIYKLGWKSRNPEIARLMDAGTILNAEVVRLKEEMRAILAISDYEDVKAIARMALARHP